MQTWYKREYWLSKCPSAEWVDTALAHAVFQLVARLNSQTIQLPEFADSEVKRCVVVVENKMREKRPDLVNFDNNCPFDDHKGPSIKRSESIQRYINYPKEVSETGSVA